MIKSIVTAIILIPSLLFGGQGMGPGPGVGKTYAGGGAIPCTGSNAFVRGTGVAGATEDFEYTTSDTCTSEWTVSGSVGINTKSSTQYKLTANSLALTDDTSQTTTSKVQVDLGGTSLTDEYYRFYLYVPDIPDNSTFELGGFSKYNSAVTGAITIVDLTGAATEYLRIAASTEYIPVTAGTWVRVEIRAYDDNIANATYTMKVWDASGNPIATSNGGSDYQVDKVGTQDAFQFLTWLPVNNSATTVTAYIDGLKNCNDWCGAE